MVKTIGAFFAAFLIFSYFSSIFEGGGGLVATTITSSIDDDDTTINVADTTGFLVPIGGFSYPTVMIGNEEVQYTGLTSTSFTGCTRAYRGTEATSYVTGKAVYSTDAGVLNKAFGFDVVSTGEAYTEISAINLAWNFFTVSIGYLATFNFAILGGDLVYLRYLLMGAFGVGLIVYLAFLAASTSI